eukprot:11762546-Ditylum_brightwellii.AAC.1
MLSVMDSGRSQQSQQSQQPEQHVGWAGLHYQLTQFNNMRDFILMDGGSTALYLPHLSAPTNSTRPM